METAYAACAEGLPPGFGELVGRMWSGRLEDRPTAAEVVAALSLEPAAVGMGGGGGGLTGSAFGWGMAGGARF